MYRLLFTVVIRRINPETAHHLAVGAIGRLGWAMAVLRALRIARRPKADGAIEVLGRRFVGPVGLAAGMDKDATAIAGMTHLGFSHVEVGTLTPKAQPGNEKPRSWREVDLRALRNRMGFNNGGADAAAARLERFRKTRLGKRALVGVNIGKNKVTAPEDAAADYGYCAKKLAPYADYLAVNVSSPNTPGLRDLQAVESLRPILEATLAEAGETPVLVKIAPDLDDADVDAAADLANELGLAGVIATNTTIAHDRGPGGLSGQPLKPRALEVVARLRKRLGAEPVIIGIGGIETEDDARAMLAAGANLLQIYTAFVYRGPFWPGRLNARLTRSANR